jgi:hypothetical protein
MYTGLGDVSFGQEVAIGGTAAGTAVSTAVAIGAIGGPLGAAIGAGIGLLTTLVGSLFQPDIKKEEATAIVNQIESQILQPNLDAWRALPDSEKTPAAQQAYLNAFDQAWRSVLKGCGNPALGSAGQNCISDRQQGGCHYTVAGQTPGVPPDCGNWFVWYRDPVANDPAVAANAAANPLSSLSSLLPSGSMLPLFLIGGLVLLAVVE